jgi:hypothetical protein
MTGAFLIANHPELLLAGLAIASHRRNGTGSGCRITEREVLARLAQLVYLFLRLPDSA